MQPPKSPSRASEARDVKLYKWMERADQLAERGAYEQSIDQALKAWQLLPRTNTQSNYAGWISGALFHSYFSLKQYQAAAKWLEIALKNDAKRVSTSDVMDIGIALFEARDFISAYDCFHQARNLGGLRAFERHSVKYLNFYLNNTDFFRH